MKRFYGVSRKGGVSVLVYGTFKPCEPARAARETVGAGKPASPAMDPEVARLLQHELQRQAWLQMQGAPRPIGAGMWFVPPMGLNDSWGKPWEPISTLFGPKR